MREVECRNAECGDFERAKDRGLGNESLVFALLFSSRYSRISQLKKKKLEEKNRKKRTRGLTCDTVLQKKLGKGGNKEADRGNEGKPLDSQKGREGLEITRGENYHNNSEMF